MQKPFVPIYTKPSQYLYKLSMKNKEIEVIIHKFLVNAATQEEIGLLAKWAKDNKSAFRQQVEFQYLITGAVEKKKSEQLKKDLIENFEQLKIKNTRKRRLQIVGYAAIFIGVMALCISYYFQNNKIVESTQQEITITLGDGTSKEILKTDTSGLVSSTSTYVAKQEGTKITYNKIAVNKKAALKPLVYNTLNVPYGRKFQVVLSDGTEVHLNSGSSITYPVAFYNEGPRKVVLKGEAYFLVKSDSLRPFSVSIGSIETRVLGTEFNISNYEDNEHATVVLVEGSLSVDKSNNLDTESIVLIPNQMASYSFSDKNLTVQNVDVSSYIAWKDGILLFKNEDFYRIAKKLERHYNIEIDIQDMEVSKERYTGRFRTETIDEILQAFQRIKEFQYSNNNNKISINPKN